MKPVYIFIFLSTLSLFLAVVFKHTYPALTFGFTASYGWFACCVYDELRDKS